MRRAAIVAVVAVAAAVGGALAVAARAPATASPAPASPEVILATTGTVSRIPLAPLSSGATSVAADQAPTAVGGTPLAAAMAADASTSIVLDQTATGMTATAVRVASGTVIGTVGLPDAAGGDVAFDPDDPSRAYAAAGTSGLLHLAVGDSVAVSSTDQIVSLDARSVAVSPDGLTVFVGGQDQGNDVVVALPVSAGGESGRWTGPASTGGVTGLAVRPDGHGLIGADGASLLQLPLPATSTSALSVAAAVAGLDTVTVGPTASTLYGAGNLASGAPFVVAAPTAAPGSVSAPVTLAGTGPVDLAVDPTGGLLVAAVGAGAVQLDPVPLGAGGTLGSPAAAVATPAGTSGPAAVAITPDQAPVAAIAAHPAAIGAASTFDASASMVAYGTITSYRWSFGDGSATTTTATPTTSHFYARAGTFTATVTETDSAGTTVPPAIATFASDSAGHTAYRRGSSTAMASATVTVAAGATSATTAAPSALGVAPGVRSVPAGAAITASPAVGPAGTIVTVTGTGFTPSTRYTITWSVSFGSADVTSDAAGRWQASLATDVPDVPGPRSVLVSGVAGLSAPFLVEAGSTEPGGPDATPLFRSHGTP